MPSSEISEDSSADPPQKPETRGGEKYTQGATSGTKGAIAGIGSHSRPGGEVCMHVAAAY